MLGWANSKPWLCLVVELNSVDLWDNLLRWGMKPAFPRPYWGVEPVFLWGMGPSLPHWSQQGPALPGPVKDEVFSECPSDCYMHGSNVGSHVNIGKTLTSISVAAGPQTQMWPSVAAWTQMSPWPWVASQATQIFMGPSDCIVLRFEPGPRWWRRPWPSTRPWMTATATDNNTV